MTFKPAVWYPIAAVLAVVNVIAVAFAVGPVDPWHATTHAVLGVAFGLWAQRLRDRRDEGADQQALESTDTLQELEAEVDMLRLELGEMQERAEFAERVLVQQQGAQPRNPPLDERS